MNRTTITEEQVMNTARELRQDEFSRADLARALKVDRSDLKPGFKAARQAGGLEKVRNDDEGTGLFRLAR